MRGDFIEVIRILKGLENIDPRKFFTVTETQT
jgi:hypothetical protein